MDQHCGRHAYLLNRYNKAPVASPVLEALLRLLPHNYTGQVSWKSMAFDPDLTSWRTVDRTFGTSQIISPKSIIGPLSHSLHKIRQTDTFSFALRITISENRIDSIKFRNLVKNPGFWSRRLLSFTLTELL